jgi:hypothetical protein
MTNTEQPEADTWAQSQSESTRKVFRHRLVRSGYSPVGLREFPINGAILIDRRPSYWMVWISRIASTGMSI